MRLNMKSVGKQIVGKPKIVGELDGKPIYHLLTKGGLSMLASADEDGELKVHGAGSHRRIAMAVATKSAPSIHFNELSKSDDLPDDILAQYLPQFLELTERIQKAAKK